MLISAHIHNFRSCTNVVLNDISSMLVLLGRNGVGKTNVLLALEWAATVGSSQTGEVPPAHADTYGDVALGLQLDGRLYEYRLCIYLAAEEPLDGEGAPVNVRKLQESLRVRMNSGPWEAIFERHGKSLTYGVDRKPLDVSPVGPAAFAIASLLPNDAVTEIIIQVMGFLSRIRYLPLDTPAKENDDYGIVSETDFLAAKNRPRKQIFDMKQLQIQLLDMYLNETEKFEEFLGLVGDRGLGIISSLEVNAVRFPKSDGKTHETYHFIRWKPAFGTETTHTFKDLSYGTRRLLRLFITLLHQQPTVLLIEQPEDGIHKGLLHKLIPALSSYCEHCQIFVASHAADILNRAEPEQIRLVNMVSGDTKVRILEEDELEAAHAFIRDEGGLADFLDMVQE